MTVQPTESILIVDFGSQVTQLIARRIREAGVYSEIAPFNAAAEAFERLNPKGIILSGGPSSVMWEDSPRAPEHFFSSGLPILGICYGQQAMAEQLGGRVAPSDNREFGRAFIDIIDDSALFDGLWKVGEKHQVWMSHGDRVEQLPEGFRIVAKSEGSPPTRSGASIRPCSTPRSCTRPTAANCSPISSVTCAAARATGPWPASRTPRLPTSANRSATAASFADFPAASIAPSPRS
jgi:GMP synthase (glutamine-hydrolysing) A subunit